MNKQIFVNLPVKDLGKSIAFFEAIGYTFNPQFTGDTTACMVINDTTFVMLMTHEKFQGFTPKAVCDSTKSAEVLISLSCESREAVDSLVAKAIAAGGSSHNPPQDHGFMYDHEFYDLDDHGWGIFWMDPAAAQQT